MKKVNKYKEIINQNDRIGKLYQSKGDRLFIKLVLSVPVYFDGKIVNKKLEGLFRVK